jgi:hypothetical protein
MDTLKLNSKVTEHVSVRDYFYSSLQPISSSNRRRAKAADWEVNSE